MWSSEADFALDAAPRWRQGKYSVPAATSQETEVRLCFQRRETEYMHVYACTHVWMERLMETGKPHNRLLNWIFQQREGEREKRR